MSLYWSVGWIKGEWRLRCAYANKRVAERQRWLYDAHKVIHGTRDEARAKVRELNHDEY